MGFYIDTEGRNPRSVIAEALDELDFEDPWDVAGHLLGELTDQDVADLSDIRGVGQHQESGMTPDAPTITRHEGDDHPTYTVEFPDPPRASYEVAHDIIEQHVDLLNRVAQLEAFVQRFIDLGYEFGDPTQLIDLHDAAVGLLPDRNAATGEV